MPHSIGRHASVLLQERRLISSFLKAFFVACDLARDYSDQNKTCLKKRRAVHAAKKTPEMPA
jgi:hypothetical protein